MGCSLETILLIEVDLLTATCEGLLALNSNALTRKRIGQNLSKFIWLYLNLDSGGSNYRYRPQRYGYDSTARGLRAIKDQYATLRLFSMEVECARDAISFNEFDNKKELSTLR